MFSLFLSDSDVAQCQARAQVGRGRRAVVGHALSCELWALFLDDWRQSVVLSWRSKQLQIWAGAMYREERKCGEARAGSACDVDVECGGGNSFLAPAPCQNSLTSSLCFPSLPHPQHPIYLPSNVLLTGLTPVNRQLWRPFPIPSTRWHTAPAILRDFFCCRKKSLFFATSLPPPHLMRPEDLLRFCCKPKK